MLHRYALPVFPKCLVDHYIKERCEQNHQKCRGNHPSQNPGADGLLRTRSGPARKGERQDPEPEGQRGHDDGTQS